MKTKKNTNIKEHTSSEPLAEQNTEQESKNADNFLEKELKPITLSKEEIDLIFEKEMLPHINSLYTFAYRLTNNEDDANDLVQETYLKAYRFFASYEQGTNAKAWLYRILKNSFINNYRKQSKEPNKIDYEEAETIFHSQKNNYNPVDSRDKVFKGLLGDEVSNALMALPVDFKTVIMLCDIEGFTYEEIAKIVDTPIGTVRSRLHRGRKMLKEMLAKYAASLGYKVTEEAEENEDSEETETQETI
ncbi:MAG: sigma-70 family RNA polymerase sigma factor [Bacteroidia bacterium]|nr:sigma-70 family RNA polymerase sigma factor [Bacteroidia bacterium]MDW8301585.1 sigma-70 family RNA polymerase sigma factor [Bacteroidia bacterium]